MQGKTILSMLQLALERQTMVSFLFDVFKERLLLHLLVELLVLIEEKCASFCKTLFGFTFKKKIYIFDKILRSIATRLDQVGS